MLNILKNIYVYGYGYQGELLNICLCDSGKVSIFKPDNLSHSGPITDLRGRYTLMPGLIDTHLHGAEGHDFTEANEENLSHIAKGLAKSGLAYFVATLFSQNFTQLKKSLFTLDNFYKKQIKQATPGEANLIGVHLEGPFISKSCKGSHDEDVLQDEINLTFFKEMINIAPHIPEWKITLCPEVKGAIEFIRELRLFLAHKQATRVKIFIGHTNANEKLIKQAFDEGEGIVVGFTHVGNACMEKIHRQTQPIQPSDVHSNLVKWMTNKKNQSYFFSYEIIADGVHLSPSFIHFLRDQIGTNKLMLVSDQLAPTGKADGEYQFGKYAILKIQDKCVLKNNPEKLAGSVTSLPRMFESYGKLIKLSKQPLMRELYTAAVLNPRLYFNNHVRPLADEDNFIIVDSDTGKIVLSACNGQIISKNFTLTHLAANLNVDKKI